ncbi:MAG: hypothetical protein V5A88_00780 [Candidatus Thermoplasmatota archaeon]
MKEKNKTLRCPKCGSRKIFPETAFITGYKYRCEDCGYVGSLILEEYTTDDED